MVRIGAGDISFSDLLDVLDAAFMVHIEGGNGNWSVMAVADFGGSRETFIDGVTYRF